MRISIHTRPQTRSVTKDPHICVTTTATRTSPSCVSARMAASRSVRGGEVASAASWVDRGAQGPPTACEAYHTHTHTHANPHTAIHTAPHTSIRHTHPHTHTHAHQHKTHMYTHAYHKHTHAHTQTRSADDSWSLGPCGLTACWHVRKGRGVT